MRFRFAMPALLVFLLMVSAVSMAQTSKIDGYMFGDYFYNVANSNAGKEDFNGFQFRRIYFTFDSNLNPDFKVRFRLESETDKISYLESVTLDTAKNQLKPKSQSLVTPYVKDAYLEWSNLIRGHKLVFGLAAPPTFELSEAVWGYRSIEKTIIDLRKVRSSREMGVGLQGALDLNSRLNHHLMIGNGTGSSGGEKDKYKLIMYSFWAVPTRGLTVQAYADYQRRAGEINDMLYKGFVGYDHIRFSVGAEAFQQVLDSKDGDAKSLGVSFFGSAIPIPGKTFKMFGRFDRWDPNTDVDDDEVNLVIGGLDFIPAGNVHIMPNIVLQSYAAEGLDSDLTARLSVYYKWSSGMF